MKNKGTGTLGITWKQVQKATLENVSLKIAS
jgi:hypothetical protein